VTSPTQRTLAYLRGQGFQCWIVERWNAYARIRQDAFGWMDILAYRITPFSEIVGVQCTSGTNHAARRAKLRALPAVEGWCKAGGFAAVVSWTKRGPRGKRKVWTPRLEILP
jgi:hypothetical protein